MFKIEAAVFQGSLVILKKSSERLLGTKKFTKSLHTVYDNQFAEKKG